MAFIIKNARDHVVHVDGVAIPPGEHLIIRHAMTGPISKALDIGDVQLDDGDETPEQHEPLHADAESEELPGEATQEI